MTTSKNAAGSAKKTTLKSHIIRNTTTNTEKSLGDASYSVVAWAEDVLELNTVQNLRSYTGEYNPRTRTKTHKAIANTLRNNPERFGQRNGGFTITCSSVNVSSEKNQIIMINDSLINGAQTQGELNLFFKELEELVESSGDKQIEVKIEIMVVTDPDEIPEIAISRNTINQVKNISQAGARGQLNELSEVMKSYDKNWIIETSESDRELANATIDTVKLLQVTRLMTPDHILSPNKEITASEILKPYKSAASCLDNFCFWQATKDNDPEAKAKYEATLSLAPKAWSEYEHWNSHPKWKGTGIQETYKTSKKRVCKKDKSGNVISCSNGLLFPVLGAIKHFTKKLPTGEWVIDKHEAFDPERMTKTAVRILHSDYQYDPMIMGRSVGAYSVLGEYPSAMIDILGLGDK